MLVVEIDGVDAEALQAPVARFLDVPGRALRPSHSPFSPRRMPNLVATVTLCQRSEKALASSPSSPAAAAGGALAAGCRARRPPEASRCGPPRRGSRRRTSTCPCTRGRCDRREERCCRVLGLLVMERSPVGLRSLRLGARREEIRTRREPRAPACSSRQIAQSSSSARIPSRACGRPYEDGRWRARGWPGGAHR